MPEADVLGREVKKLVDRYRKLESTRTSQQMAAISEADVRADLIDPLFEALGWDIHDPDEYDREHYVRDVGRADIGVKLRKEPVIFVEAKRFGMIPHVNARGGADWLDFERQALNYAARKRIRWAILTNFEKFRLFNALNGLTILDFESFFDYSDRLEELRYLSKEYVETGKLDSLERRRERPDIDRAFLDRLNVWRLHLAEGIYVANANQFSANGGGLEALRAAVQRILDRLIIIRYAEDRLILETPDQLLSLIEAWSATRSYTRLWDIVRGFFRGFDDRHDSALFAKGHVADGLEVPDDILEKIVRQLYETNFRKFDFDVLGNTYESYLGSSLKLADGKLQLKADDRIRHSGGVYYTPTYIVDFIVRNTIGEVLRGLGPQPPHHIRILDPACGSGSFLIKAFDYVAEAYRAYNTTIIKERRARAAREGEQMKLAGGPSFGEILDFETTILKDNLFGVDIDPQATEIASVNLMLKALKRGEKLPLILGENVVSGNSLVDPGKGDLGQFFGEPDKKRPLNFRTVFSRIFQQGGFDVVLGNPPYIGIESIPEDEKPAYRAFYNTFEFRGDVFGLFLERAITELARPTGFVGFIVPSRILNNDSYAKLRGLILTKTLVRRIVVLGTNVFPGVANETLIVVLQRTREGDDVSSNLVEIVTDIQDLSKARWTSYEVSQADLLSRPGFTIPVLGKTGEDAVISKMLQSSMRLGIIAKATQGIIQGGNRGLLRTEVGGPEDKMVVRGKDIDRYFLRWAGLYVRYDRVRLHRPREQWKFEDHDKIIVQEIRNIDLERRVIACYDDSGYYALNTTNVINLIDRSVYTAKALLGILNSELVNEYFRRQYLDTHIKTKYLENLPLPPVDPSDVAKMTTLVTRRIALEKDLRSLQSEVGPLVNSRPRVSDVSLSSLLSAIPGSETESLPDAHGRSVSQLFGKLLRIQGREEAGSLILQITFHERASTGTTVKRTLDAVRISGLEPRIRALLADAIGLAKASNRRSNIFRLLLNIPLPAYSYDVGENLQVLLDLGAKHMMNKEKAASLSESIDVLESQIEESVREWYSRLPAPNSSLPS